jgi:hypothetical protein
LKCAPLMPPKMKMSTDTMQPTHTEICTWFSTPMPPASRE